ncbi:hypothetical protein V2J09_019287 [Rumex salicifolius]
MFGKRRRGKANREKETYNDDQDSQFKSKNLQAERRRRARLHHNTLHLRSLVPIITNAIILYMKPNYFSNMTKETTIMDAITYIEKLQGEVDQLTELLEMEASEPQREFIKPEDSALETYGQEEKLQVEPEVKVIRIDADKLWVKVIFEKRTGRLTQIIEALNSFGYQMTDMSFAATRGAATFTSCLEEMLGVFRSEEETRDMLLGIIASN